MVLCRPLATPPPPCFTSPPRKPSVVFVVLFIFFWRAGEKAVWIPAGAPPLLNQSNFLYFRDEWGRVVGSIIRGVIETRSGMCPHTVATLRHLELY